MSKTRADTWSDLTVATWMFASEAGMVMWLRSWRLMMGGPVAEREARRMVSEKLVANMTLLPAIMQGGVSSTLETFSARALEHYAKPVRANCRRLAGK